MPAPNADFREVWSERNATAIHKDVAGALAPRGSNCRTARGDATVKLAPASFILRIGHRRQLLLFTDRDNWFQETGRVNAK